MLKVYTSQFRYSESDRLDTTVKTGDKVFAPTWDMVMGHKNGTITDEEYTQKYYEMMRKSYKENNEVWKELLNRNKVVLICYCPPNKFCHRHLLKDMLVKCGAEYCGEIENPQKAKE